MRVKNLILGLILVLTFCLPVYAIDDGLGLIDQIAISSNKAIPAQIILRGHYKIVLKGSNGQIKEVREGYNTVVNNGKYGVMDQILASPTLAKAAYMAVGTGAMTCAAATNALVTELDRNALTSKTRSNAVVTMVGDWAAGDGTGALTEAGTFDAAAAGNMWMCASFSVINKGASDTLQITWTLTGS
ncbi:MAG: hypothetical protein ACOYWZ_20130 [Bacillota bacterium]